MSDLIEVRVLCEEGDVISSKKGFRGLISPLTNTEYEVLQFEVCNKGLLRAIKKRVSPNSLDYEAVRKHLEKTKK